MEKYKDIEHLISVIVPIYNVEKYVKKCIESIINQTYRNIEIILVDDGSIDKSGEICDEYSFRDNRIKVLHQRNRGPAAARKEGVLLATGKYIGYVDGDDWIEPDMYKNLLDYACRYDVDVVESGVIDSWNDEEKKRTSYLDEGCYKGIDFIEKVEPRLLYAGTFFEYGITPYMWSKLFLKEKIMKYQLLEGKTNIMHDDVMVSLPCIAASKKLYITHDCYYHYRVRYDSLKRSTRKNEVANLVNCYSDFFVRFKGSVLSSKNDKQIKFFLMYLLLYITPYVFDKCNKNTFLVPFGDIRIGDRLVIYGAGAAGIHLERYVRSVKGSKIVCWVDHNYENLQDMLNVVSPSEILAYEYDYVIISIMRGRAVQSAKNELIDLGVSEKKILWIEQKYIDNPELLLNKVMG